MTRTELFIQRIGELRRERANTDSGKDSQMASLFALGIAMREPGWQYGNNNDLCAEFCAIGGFFEGK